MVRWLQLVNQYWYIKCYTFYGFFKKKFIYLFLDALSLHWFFFFFGVDFLRFSLASASRDCSPVVVLGRLVVVASLVAERGLSSCGTRPQLPRGLWDLPRPGMEAISPALAGGFLSTTPQGKSQFYGFWQTHSDMYLPTQHHTEFLYCPQPVLEAGDRGDRESHLRRGSHEGEMAPEGRTASSFQFGFWCQVQACLVWDEPLQGQHACLLQYPPCSHSFLFLPHSHALCLLPERKRSENARGDLVYIFPPGCDCGQGLSRSSQHSQHSQQAWLPAVKVSDNWIIFLNMGLTVYFYAHTMLV